MNRLRLKKILLLAALLVFTLVIAWWGLRKLDPTSSAIFISNSPDGKYCCAVFCKDGIFGGHAEYTAGLFDGRWPHHELAGKRFEWSHDSVNSSDFRPTWRPDGVEINFRTGFGDNRATISGSDLAGTQQWIGP